MILTSIPVPHAVAQEDGTRYRVEVLVFRHLSFEDEPELRSQMTAYTTAREFHDGTEPLAFGECSVAPDIPFRSGVVPETVDPKLQVVPLPSRSELMEDVWRRLRLGAHYRPEVFLAWEQPAVEPFPLLRLHNQELLEFEDPRPDLRGLATTMSWPCPGEDGENEVSGQFIVEYDPEAGDLMTHPLPALIPHYRLDGTVRLRRARFLHIDLDLVYRERLFEQSTEPVIPFLAPGTETSEGDPIGPPAYRVQWLQQSRQVRSDRMEYFDSPWIGVLVWISEIEPEETETVP